jgi:predicted MPP superfamily phosphohydrolase
MRVSLRQLIAAGMAAGALGGAWSLAETHRFRMRFQVVPVLPEGCRPIRLLHVSDMHITPYQGDKKRWIAALSNWQPDLVIGTGDFLAHRYAVPVALDALAPLSAFPGAFVLGSNDYFAPTSLNPAKYLSGPSRVDTAGRPPLPWPDLVAGFTRFGWFDLGNRRERVKLDGLELDLRGVDDPHIHRDDYAAVAGPFDSDAGLRLGVAHAPYRRVLDPMTTDGADLLIAGHTHGGQLRVPGVGALVTNCDLPRSMARGLHRYRTKDASATTWLHVSAGLGQSPYAPIRFACPPEATLLTLVGSDYSGSAALG